MALRLDRLRQSREQKGLTQDELAQRCGFSKTQMFRYEKGMNDPTSAVLALLVRELGVSADYLLGFVDEPKGHIGDELSHEQRKLLDAFENADSRTLFEMIGERLKQLPPKE